jgi:hypothetical protein
LTEIAKNPLSALIFAKNENFQPDFSRKSPAWSFSLSSSSKDLELSSFRKTTWGHAMSKPFGKSPDSLYVLLGILNKPG